MVLLLYLAVMAAGVVGLWLLGHSNYGYLRLSEVPGFLCILLAGHEYRRHAAVILAARSKRSAPALPSMGGALPEGGYPIASAADLGRAQQAIRRCGLAACTCGYCRGHHYRPATLCGECARQARRRR